jgi:hypothetical protein
MMLLGQLLMISAIKRDNIDETIRVANSSHIGKVKERLAMDINVLRTVYSRRYDTYYVTAMNKDDNVVFFGYCIGIASGKKIHIRGTVKAHRDNGQTQLNRVFVK